MSTNSSNKKSDRPEDDSYGTSTNTKKKKKAKTDGYHSGLDGVGERQLSSFAWRIDPDISFSDWKIVVEVEEEKHDFPTKSDGSGATASAAGGTATHLVPENPFKVTTKEFHVHRAVLTYGKRRSGYFTTLFQLDSYTDTLSKTTTMALPRLVFDVFERFLDYAYGAAPSSCIDGALTAIPLVYLSDRLDNPTLMQEALAATTRRWTRRYGLDEAKMLMEGSGQPVAFWLAMLRLMIPRLTHSWMKELLVMDVCRTFRKTLSPEQFAEITQADVLPDFVPTRRKNRFATVFELLEIEEDILGTLATGTATDFQKRFIQFITAKDNWSEIRIDKEQKQFIMQRPDLSVCVLSKL